MAAVSKRAQARNEKDLQEVLRNVPGNNQCADCQTRNPGWASWNLGVFLCMRCASIHRKLGTHISKVKSLSMDTWTAEQVESMKQNGNVAANKIYNPKNRRPDIPLDADEVDSAMERYIRKKYQEKSLSSGKPLPPSRNDVDTYSPRSPEHSPPPPLPPKKGKFFGFGLRAVSSAYPLSKHEKKRLPPEPRVDRAFRISSENYTGSSRSGPGLRLSDDELQRLLIQLQEMGFRDTTRNTEILRAADGDIERTIATLVKMGDSNKSTSRSVAPKPSESTTTTSTNSAFPTEAEVMKAHPPLPQASNNPFDQMSNGPTAGISFTSAQQLQHTGNSMPSSQVSSNPFDVPVRSQTDQGISQAFQGMQISQPLFPHSTGGYPAQVPILQDPRLQYSMTPPIPSVPHQYGYVASPGTLPGNSNPFFQTGPNIDIPSSNPYATLIQSQSPVGSSSNPFNTQQTSAPQLQLQQQFPQQSQPSSSFNPFGIPPGPQLQQNTQSQAFYPSQSIFDNPQPPQLGTYNTQPSLDLHQANQTQFQAPSPTQLFQPAQNFQYGQPQPQTQYAQYQQQSTFQPQQYQGLPQQLMPQQTGRFNKSDILALYNYPLLAPQPPLASIPEPTESQPPLISAPTTDLFGPNAPTSPKRSATMPVSASSMYSAGGGGSRNPFLSNNPSGASTPMAGMASRHASAESVSINNLQNGRHSPDAFANLSARYMK